MNTVFMPICISVYVSYICFLRADSEMEIHVQVIFKEKLPGKANKEVQKVGHKKDGAKEV